MLNQLMFDKEIDMLCGEIRIVTMNLPLPTQLPFFFYTQKTEVIDLCLSTSDV
jgi:hypothetical protein